MEKVRYYSVIMFLVQGLYLLAAALWPLFDIGSFMRVAQIETDSWLLRTTGIFMLASSFCLLSAFQLREHSWPVTALAFFSAAGCVYVDMYYYFQSDMQLRLYMLDALAELFFAVAWIVIIAGYYSWKHSPQVTEEERKKLKL